MRFQTLLAIVVLFTLPIYSQVVITTIAGTGTEGFNGDGIPATDAELSSPSGLCLLNDEELYFTDLYNNRLRLITLSGTITTIAGNGEAGYNGDHLGGTIAELNRPSGICTDSVGNIYIADWFNNRVRKIDFATGIIYTIAGYGMYGYNGDNIPATSAKLSAPSDVVMDKEGNLFIADHDNNRIRVIKKGTNIILTYAGSGIAAYVGDGGSAKLAAIDRPTGLCFDKDENLIIVDHGNACIRKVDKTTGIITTIAGNHVEGFGGDGFLATEASLDHPTSVCFDKEDNLYIADQENNRIRKVDTESGIITTFAGTGVEGFSGDGGDPLEAELAAPWDIVMDSADNMFISDLGNNRIRKIAPKESDPSGIISQNKSDVSLYPNPVLDYFFILLPENIKYIEQCSGIIYNSGGIELKRIARLDSQTNISINNLLPGFYTLRIVAKEKCYSISFVKCKS